MVKYLVALGNDLHKRKLMAFFTSLLRKKCTHNCLDNVYSYTGLVGTNCICGNFALSPVQILSWVGVLCQKIDQEESKLFHKLFQLPCISDHLWLYYLIDNLISDKLSAQSFWLFLVMTVFNCRWNCLPIVLEHVWYAVIIMCWVSSSVMNSLKSWDLNWEPQSVVIVKKNPELCVSLIKRCPRYHFITYIFDQICR